jgi:hypothetical protein
MERTPLEIVRLVCGVLDSLGVPYLVGGSFASSIQGVARLTQDADFVVDLRADQLAALAERLSGDFYVNRDAMAEAERGKRSFNAIHVESGFKIDFFVLGREPFDLEEFGRREALALEADESHRIFFKTPEDTILRKLQWYRAGGEVSDQQWRDVLGVLAVSADQLDAGYLSRWAAVLNVADLLERARGEARLRDR